MFFKIFKLVLTFVPTIIDAIAKAKRAKRDQQNQIEIQRKNINEGMKKMTDKIQDDTMKVINEKRKDKNNG